MKIYSLKSIARRGTMLGAAFAIAASSFTPFAPAAFADALNPLTERSLTLSSSAPGWDYTDGSGNSTYAPPNSGANGQKVGNYFDFKVTTDTATGNTLKAMSFQYCTNPAGDCLAPGDNGWADEDTRDPDSTSTSDLNITVTSPSQASIADDDPTDNVTISSTSVSSNPNGNFASLPCSVDDTPGVPGYQDGDCSSVAGKNFAVYYDNAGTWTESPNWAMNAVNFEQYNGAKTSGAIEDRATGKNNEIQLVNTGTTGFASGTRVRVVFFATDTNYITNPGSGAFFVRINTFNAAGATDINSMDRYAEDHVIDGGVTVANVMNLGIQIITKVLETMDFSVGVVDPYTLQAIADDAGTVGVDESETSALYAANSHTKHSVCEPILTKMLESDTTTVPNRLQLGDETGEFSLSTDRTYSTHSYWRLSSNSSAGATVYYSGNTLTNTVDDEIEAIGPTSEDPLEGSEQFGLALANGTIANNATGPYEVNYGVERGASSGLTGAFENGADNNTNGIHASVTNAAISNLQNGVNWHTPRLYPLMPETNYQYGAGVVNDNYNGQGSSTTEFAFDANSTLVPVPLASQDDQVVNCVTGKMRYIANIAATTPAGIYTTKINYIAAPQY